MSLEKTVSMSSEAGFVRFPKERTHDEIVDDVIGLMITAANRKLELREWGTVKIEITFQDGQIKHGRLSEETIKKY